MKQIWLCMLSKAIILAQEIGIAGLTAIRGIATATMTSNQYRIISFQPSTTLRIGTPENNDGPDISKWISMKYSKGSHISLLDVLWSAGMEQLFIEEKNWNSKTPTVALKKRVMSILRVWCPFSGCWALLQWWSLVPVECLGREPAVPFSGPIRLELLAHLMLKLANHLGKDETTTGYLKLQGFASDHPGGTIVPRQHNLHKILISENVHLDFPRVSLAALQENWTGLCPFISLE